jgi:membrane protein YdbS with pleckstrin-like domain
LLPDTARSDKTDTDGEPVKKNRYQTLIIVYVCLILINIANYWLIIESLYWASKSNVNVGVVMAIFVIKPILSGILFNIFFGVTYK